LLRKYGLFWAKLRTETWHCRCWSSDSFYWTVLVRIIKLTSVYVKILNPFLSSWVSFHGKNLPFFFKKFKKSSTHIADNEEKKNTCLLQLLYYLLEKVKVFQYYLVFFILQCWLWAMVKTMFAPITLSKYFVIVYKDFMSEL
jgi:hypothetical protein